MVHITRKRTQDNPMLRVGRLSIHPQALPTKEQPEPGMRWLGVFLDRKLKFRRHVIEKAASAAKVARHMRSLAAVQHGPPAASMRKAVITCVLPVLLYGADVWYVGRKKPPALRRRSR